MQVRAILTLLALSFFVERARYSPVLGLGFARFVIVVLVRLTAALAVWMLVMSPTAGVVLLVLRLRLTLVLILVLTLGEDGE